MTEVTQNRAAFLCGLIGGRLPTGHEWERAARWVDGSYPLEAQIVNYPSPSELAPVLETDAEPNPWGVKEATGLVWQWTQSKDAKTGKFVCKGSWWEASLKSKLNAAERLIPKEDKHQRTGFRVVIPEVDVRL